MVGCVARHSVNGRVRGRCILARMEQLKAVVKNGRLVLDTSTDLPEGTEVELSVVDDADAELIDELEGSEADEAAGNLVDFDTVLARLVSKPH